MDCFDVYNLYPIEPVAGKGNYVYDSNGVEYLDLYGGHAVISVGHSHPEYIDAISKQLGKLGFYSNSVQNSLQRRLAKKLGEISGYEDYSLFLCNSGAEANENAIKLASFHTGKRKILAFNKAFHGRTSGAVAATDNPKISSPFNQTDNVVFSELNNMSQVEEILHNNEFAAVIIEGIQGVAGIRVPDNDFLIELREYTKKKGIVLILDEVQSGYGRSGKFFSHQYSGIRPDIITTAKGMGNGFPIGGVIISPEFKAEKGMLGTTFGGNHLACAAAISVLNIIEKENLIANAAEVGNYAIEELKKIGFPISDVRGRGLMIGIDVDNSCPDIRRRLLMEKHIFTGGSGISTIRLLPALNIKKHQIDHFITALKDIQK